MKKSLVLAMAMALGVTASAYAANPFSDVPAGHWAYGSIEKLAAAGVVDGYPDGSFKGDNLMTRYEMAQIVAKAMAKGANVDALAAEFAEELDNLGVRVAALEKKADNVKITGQIRYNYNKVASSGASTSNLRSRITLAGQINDDWKYSAMLQNIQEFTHSKDSGAWGPDNNAEETITWQRAYIDGKLGGLAVRGGRYNFSSYNATNFTNHASSIYEHRMEGVSVSYGKAIKLQGTAGKLVADTGKEKDYEMWAGDISAKLGKNATLNVGYYNLNGIATAKDKEIINVGLQTKLGKNITAGVDWLKVNSDEKYDGNDGWIAAVAYKGAKAAQPGSWGIQAKWVDVASDILVAEGWDGQASVDGGQGYGLGAYYTVAKNIVAGVEYFNVKQANDRTENLWSQVIFTF